MGGLFFCYFNLNILFFFRFNIHLLGLFLHFLKLSYSICYRIEKLKVHLLIVRHKLSSFDIQ